MKGIILRHSALPKITGLKNGILYFVCTCGKQSSIKLKNFTILTRCKECTLKSKYVKATKNIELNNDVDKLKLLDIFLSNGLGTILGTHG